jgi:hypothetical protein
MNRERASELVLGKNVATLPSESVDLSVESSVMMLTPGHAVASLVGWNVALCEHTRDLTDLSWIDGVGSSNAGRWDTADSPSTVVASVVSGHWWTWLDFKSFWTAWNTDLKAFIVD